MPMEKAKQNQVAHESETQRQHVRLPMPARVTIGGKKYEIKDLSSGGVAVKDIEGEFKRGQKIPLRLKLPFGSFALDAHFEAEVQHYNTKEKSLGCVFTNLTTEHISLLNHMLKAYLAGDIVAAGDLLGIASRDNFTKARKQPAINAGVHDFKRQIPGLLAIGLGGIVIALFILGNLYTSLFIVKAADAAVSAPVAELRPAADGIFHAKLDPGLSLVEPGQVIGEVAGAALKSPCRCYIVSRNAADGAFVSAGRPVITLAPVDAVPWITAQVDPADALKINTETKASISVFGSKTEYTGHVTGMESGLADSAQAYAVKPVMVRIETAQKLPVGLVNRPAAVSFSVH